MKFFDKSGKTYDRMAGMMAAQVKTKVKNVVNRTKDDETNEDPVIVGDIDEEPEEEPFEFGSIDIDWDKREVQLKNSKGEVVKVTDVSMLSEVKVPDDVDLLADMNERLKDTDLIDSIKYIVNGKSDLVNLIFGKMNKESKSTSLTRICVLFDDVLGEVKKEYNSDDAKTANTIFDTISAMFNQLKDKN